MYIKTMIDYTFYIFRELPGINDITLEITCQNDVKFLDEHDTQPSLQVYLLNATFKLLLKYF